MIDVQTYLGYSQKILAPELMEKIYQIDQTDFPFPWPLAQWQDCQLYPLKYFIITAFNTTGELTGYALFHLSIEESLAHLLKICTKAGLRQQGLGRDLLRFAIDDLRRNSYLSIYLEVSVHNTAAQRLYYSQSFIKLGLKKRFYSNGEDAWAMQRKLE